MGTFLQAYVDLVHSTTQVVGDFGSELVPYVDKQDWAEKRRAVSRSAGAALPAYSRHGSPYTVRGRSLDPVANWEMSLRDPQLLPPETVAASVESAMGAALQELAEAEPRERGLIGLIAGFFRWRSDLQEAVGAGHPTQQKAAGVVGAFAQALAVALAGSAAVTIAAGLAKLWGWLF
jgi:hypothetical protein